MSGELDQRLVVMLLAVAGYTERRGWPEPVVTCIFRTREEQKRIYGKDKPPFSVHEFWRGLDLRASEWGELRCRELAHWINNVFVYGKGKEACLYHNVGRGQHLHLQVPPWKGAGRPRINLRQ